MINNETDFLMEAAIRANAALLSQERNANSTPEHLARQAWVSAQALLNAMPKQVRTDIGADPRVTS